MARENSSNSANLDALVPRADLYEPSESISADVKELRITDLEPSVTYSLLRKPDFQRETANWNPPQIVDLIETFCANDIIPAIILWQSGTHIFVVDGCHRLSALIGWVRGDFGGGPISIEHYGARISSHQRRMHDETMRLVEASVGPWDKYLKDNQLLSLKAMQIQWVEGRTADQAAKAFHRINRGGTVIDPLEARILQAGQSALSVSTRVIANRGTGYAYWQRFTDQRAKDECPRLGNEIHKLLFEPELRHPIKSTEVPLAGSGYGTNGLRLTFDIVSAATNLRVPDSSKGKIEYSSLPRDEDGIQTLNYLSRTHKAVRRILSNDASSFGLHPALWFYSEHGDFQPAALINLLNWLIHLERKNMLDEFRRNRGAMEDVIIDHRVIVKPATHTLGSGRRTRTRAISILDRLLELAVAMHSKDEIWNIIQKEFRYIGAIKFSLDDEEGVRGGTFKSATKNRVTLSDLSTVERCPLCMGLMHPNGKVLDHIEKRSKGGTSAAKNARWVHPVCNSNREKDEASLP